MASRMFGILVISGSLMLATLGVARANRPYRPPEPRSSAPELDPSALAAGIALLSGGVIVLTERRRNKR